MTLNLRDAVRSVDLLDGASVGVRNVEEWSGRPLLTLPGDAGYEAS